MEKGKILFLSIYKRNMMTQYEDISICFLASVLRECGYEVKIKYLPYEKIDATEILDYNPLYIGLPIYEETCEIVYDASKRIKELLPWSFVFVGGYHATFFHDKILKECLSIDCVVRNEGEETVKELIDTLEHNQTIHNVFGITFRNENGKITVNEKRKFISSLDELPFPSRDILIDNNLKIALLQTSRGCTGSCSFCCTNKVWSDWRGKQNIKKIVDEFETVVNDCGIRYFDIIDCSFEDPPFLHNKRLKNIAHELVERNLGISYFCAFRADFIDELDDELMNLLKKSGLCGAAPGIETANEFDLKLYGKRASLEQNFRFIEKFQQSDIALVPGFINFNPYSTVDGLKQNIFFLKKYGFACHLYNITNSLFLYEGNKIYERIKKDGLITSKSDNSRFNYNFVNVKIGKLYEFCQRFVSNLNEQSNYELDKLNYFTSVYWLNLSHYKRQCEVNNDELSLMLLAKHKRKIDSCFQEMNEKFSDWFIDLLQLCDTEWDEDRAELISNEKLDKESIIKYGEYLSKEKMLINLSLLKQNRDYKKWLL